MYDVIGANVICIDYFARPNYFNYLNPPRLAKPSKPA